ncbi:MAG: SDR family NAD(P)-dependent oxidoreductase [Acidimicrobiia bacterium]
MSDGTVLEGKVAIVTGASAGIGRAYALALAGAGATVVAVARRRDRLADVAASARGLPGEIRPSSCDVAVEADLMRAIDDAAALGHIDVLVNNAAILASAEPLATTGDEWDRIMRVNVGAPYVAIREVAPSMIRQGAGSIVNITARAAAFVAKGDRAQGSVAYAVSKAALNRLSFFMAEELKPHGIAVNALSPGIVATETALARNPSLATSGEAKQPTPEVLGPAVVFLAQQTAATLTGQVLHTDDYGKGWP